MHGHGDVAQHGFRTSRGDGQSVFAVRALQLFASVGSNRALVSKGIEDRPQVAVFLLADHFEVGNRGLQHRIPVHQALATVDVALLEQLDEGFLHRLDGHRIHGEHRAIPVARGTQTAHLPLDRVARLFAPLPDLFDEGLATETVAALAFRQVAVDYHFGGDASVVGTQLPQRVEAAHAVVADQRVLQRVLEGVAHVQRAGDVRRRQHDGVGLALAAGAEIAAVLPALVEAGFEGFGLVALFHGRLPDACGRRPDHLGGSRRL